MSDNKFFARLKEKLSAKVTRDFDKKFWAEFERSVNIERPRRWKPFFYPVAAAAVLFLCLAIGLQMKNRQAQMLADSKVVLEIFEEQEMLHDMELLSSFLDIPLSDEDWKQLEEG
jgi:hypothetical protein